MCLIVDMEKNLVSCCLRLAHIMNGIYYNRDILIFCHTETDFIV